MAPIIQALLTAGPGLIRLFGQSKGGTVESVAEIAASTMENTNNAKTPHAQEKALEAALAHAPESVLVELKMGLAEIDAKREKNVLDHDLGMHKAQQATLQSKDIKGVRPEIASRHSWFTVAYVVLFEGASLAEYGTGANWEIATLLAAPTLAWFGFRTWDKFSKQGASI